MNDGALTYGSRERARDPRLVERSVRIGVLAVALAVVLLLGLWLVVYENSRPHFTVGVHDNVIAHMPGISSAQKANEAINVAHKVGLPIYETFLGRVVHRLTPLQAHQLEGNTDAHGIYIPVYPGDVVDARWSGHFTPAPGKRPAASR